MQAVGAAGTKAIGRGDQQEAWSRGEEGWGTQGGSGCSSSETQGQGPEQGGT